MVTWNARMFARYTAQRAAEPIPQPTNPTLYTITCVTLRDVTVAAGIPEKEAPGRISKGARRCQGRQSSNCRLSSNKGIGWREINAMSSSHRDSNPC
eukprot:1093010-Amorphochlora_amoeboformis.AAC.1